MPLRLIAPVNFLQSALPALLIALLAAALPGQLEPPPLVSVAYEDDSGYVRNDDRPRESVIAFPVVFEQATSIALHFSQVELAGSVERGNASILRITSLLDGAYQTMNAEHVLQWGMRSAYFNGDTVLVEVIASPGTGANRVAIDGLEVGLPPLFPESQCGPTDDRVPSSDPRVARLMPVACTAWMINDCAKCFLSAGHCGNGGGYSVQFNVPNSTSSGSLVFPPPSDQYAVDASSHQSENSTDDWQYFGVFANSTTGLTPFQTMGQAFDLVSPPGPGGTTIRITGHGSDSTPDNTFNQIQQTHTGPMTGLGTNLSYQVDTTGGNSGSPVIWEQQDAAIGVHTNAGCSTGGGGSNTGTPITAVALQAALNNPAGRCLVVDGFGFDCNNNGTDDSCDIASGVSQDLNGNDIPDDCEPPITLYVDNTGNCPGSGTDVDPFCTLADAISSSITGDTIIVRTGTGIYSGLGNINLDFGGRGITVRSENGPQSVTLDAENGFGVSLFSFTNGETAAAVLEGFTLTGGNSAGSGGAIRCVDSSPTIRNCVIVQNLARMQGGGVFIDGGSPTLLNCTIADNTAGTPPFFQGQGGGLVLLDSAAVIRNCTFAHNQAVVGFVPGEGGGLYVEDSSTASVVNSIVWGNAAGIGSSVHVAAGGDPGFSDSDVQGGFAGNAMLDIDPLFVRAGPLGDYHLQSGSPCDGVGDSLLVGGGETDVDGDERVLGGAVELGSDEIVGLVCQTDLGFAGDGGVVFSICGEPLDTGNTATVVVDGAPPNAGLFFVIGLVNNPVPFAGGSLVPLPILAIEFVGADGSGHFEAVIGGGGGPGNVYVQVVSDDPGQPSGYGLSNALELVLGP